MEHTHEHTHEHEHIHSHEHTHLCAAAEGSARTAALLAYMIEHNDHHASELAELADTLEGAARQRLMDAIGSFEVANTQLRDVLSIVKGE